MKRLDLIKTLQKKADISMREAELVVERFFGGISDALADGEKMEIRGFCTFFKKIIRRIQGEIPKPMKKLKLKLKECRFSSLQKCFLIV